MAKSIPLLLRVVPALVLTLGAVIRPLQARQAEQRAMGLFCDLELAALGDERSVIGRERRIDDGRSQHPEQHAEQHGPERWKPDEEGGRLALPGGWLRAERGHDPESAAAVIRA